MVFSFSAPTTTQPQPATIPSFQITGASTPGAGPAPTPFSFGAPAAASGSNPQPAAGTSLFGGGQQQGQQSVSGGFSFGNKPAQPAAAPGLFGQSTTTQPSGGLFGQTQAQTQPSGGLFGQTQPQTQPSGGLFGQNQPQTQQSGGLFGQTQNQPQQNAGTGLFGQSQQQQPQAQTGLFGQLPGGSGGGLFGQSSTQQGQGLGNSLLGGQSAQNQQNTGTGGGQGGVNKSTKFSELPAEYQQGVEQIDAFIKERKSVGRGINTDDLGKAIWRTTTEIKSCTEESSALTQSLQNTAQALTSLQSRFVTEEEDVRRLAEIWETYKAVDGRPGSLKVAGHKEWPAEFFGRISRGLEERVGRYKTTIAQLNRVVLSLTSESETPSPHAIAQTIHNHQNALITLAAQLESLQVRMNSLRDVYATEYRERTGSMRDPFEVAREEKGIPAVRA